MLFAPGAPAISGLLYAGLSYDPVADFAPVSLVGTYPSLLVVPNSSPFAKAEDFIAYAKANPGKISWASPGIGSVPHLAGEFFKRTAGIDITHVPYRGVAAGAMTDLLAGRLDAMFNTTGSLLQPVKSNQVRALRSRRPSALRWRRRFRPLPKWCPAMRRCPGTRFTCPRIRRPRSSKSE